MSDRPAILDLLTILAESPSDWTGWPPERQLFSADSRQFVATYGPQIVGLAIQWRNELHPARHRFNLAVHPDHRRRGIARALWTLLAEEGQPPWQTSVDSRNVSARAMLALAGFDPIMRTHLGHLRSTTDPPSRPALPDGWSLVRLIDAPADAQHRDSVARLHSENYADQHAWDPADRAVLDDEAVELFIGSDEHGIDPDNTVLAFHAGTPMGVGSLRGNARAGVVELGLVGVVRRAGPTTSPVAIALTDWCLNRAAELNVAVALEVDDANAPVLEALGAWGVVWSQECFTYALDPRTG